MVFKKSKKRWIRKIKPTATKIAKRALKIAKSIRPEVKYSDTAFTNQQLNFDPTNAYTLSPFTAISQGTADANQRIGDKIKVLSHHAKFTLHNSAFDSVVYRLVCFQLIGNPDSTITKASVGNMFMESAYSGTINAVNAPTDYDNRKEFKKLYDKTFTLNPGTGASGAAVDCRKQVHVVLKPLQTVQYSAATTSMVKGELYWLFLSDLGVSASRYCTGVLRTFYTDA